MKSLLETHGMLVGGKLAKAPGRIPRKAIREIGGIAGFLEERSRLSDLKPWIPAIDDSGQTNSVAWHRALAGRFDLLEALELPYMPPEATGPGRAEAVAFNCRGLASQVRKVTGYDFLYADYRVRLGSDSASPEPDADPFRFAFDSSSGAIRFQGRDSVGLAIDLAGHFQKLRERYPDAYDLNLPAEEMLLEAEDASMKVLVQLRSVDGVADPDGARLQGFTADIFMAQKAAKPRARPKPPALAQIAPEAEP